MTAQVFTASVKPGSIFSLEKKKGGRIRIDATADTALAAITTANRVSDVLQILSDLVERAEAVTGSSIGAATSVRL
jgi:hypothetical protein